VVFSDETLGGIEHADPAIHHAMSREFARWDDIDIHFKGQVITSGGHGFAAMSRRRLLQILQERCMTLGIMLRFNTEAPPLDTLSAQYDLVVGSDGVNSATRTRYADSFRPRLDVRRCKFMWLGTDLVFDAFKFYIVETPHGVMQIHGYPFDATGSTFIVEMNDAVWQRAGFARHAARPFTPGESDGASIAEIRTLFSDILGGHAVHANNSRWISFTTVRNDAWSHNNVVLLGDAAHTAHFSIGSGTKLAMEDALALAACLHEQPGITDALAAYEAERKPVVVSTQRAAQASLEWFENLGQYVHQDPLQFAFNILTRSRRVTYDNLRLRDPEFVARVDAWFDACVQHEVGRHAGPDAPPMFQPFHLRGLELKNRVIVSAMDMYSATDGMPNDFHLVNTGSKALGGAGVVMTEMVCVSTEGRITPGCAGMYRPEHEAAWRRVVEFVHERTSAHIGLQLGHSGRKGSTKLMWEGIDEPLPDDNWEVVGPSALAYSPLNQVPRELTTAEMDAIREQFISAAEAGHRAGFDLLELHCAHGYLLSSFISPITNQRTDGYGGSLDHRMRYPLEVFDAIRAVWPPRKPMTVRISATDWYEGGIDADDAVEIARAFAAHGADAIDVSSGQVLKDERPAFGRSYQTPYADRIRNEVGIATIAVGVISSYDDVNSIVLAGRADLCALARAHLYDPQWTLHAAADQSYSGPGVDWPDPFKAGSRKPQSGRTDGPKPRLQLIREGEVRTHHSRWRPERRR
jgi:anthraniloyl-CoA monooxygenase